MKVVALRSRPAGGGFKPPRAALAEDCCGERSRKRHPVRCQVGVRETSASESLLTCRNKDRRHQNRGIVSCPGRSLADARRLARRCPAWRRREPDLPRPNGTGEGAHRHGRRWPRACDRTAARGSSAPVAVRAGGPARSSGEASVMGAERRGRVIRGLAVVGQPRRGAAGEELGMGASDSPGKPFDISKRDVWDAWLKVKENQGAPGVDGQSIADFEKDLKNNLYKVWNRMSSGSYFPPPVRAVEIEKPHGEGMRTLGIPTVADRIAQTVVAKHLQERVEPVFHPDSYGYRPGRSANDAVQTARRRCWQY